MSKIIELLKEINSALDGVDNLRTVTDLTATENKEYLPEDYGVDCFGKVNVDVQPVLEELTITANGEYTPQDGVDGFSKVTAEFDMSSLPKVKVSAFSVTNDCINEEGRWDGETSIDTSEITTLRRIFKFIDIKSINVSGWNTPKLVNLYEAFYETLISDFHANNLIIDNVTTLGGILYHCVNLENVSIWEWNTSKVTDMSAMFTNCKKLKRLDLHGWKTSSVTTVSNMFSTDNALEWLDITGWNMSSANNVVNFLYKCTSLSTLIGDNEGDDITTMVGLKVSLDLSYTNINHASLRAVINGLADLTGQTTQTLTLGATLIAKLTEEDIAIAVNKNWTIV